tara:strand:+ start:3321 stop:3518 length:198 start_codon:yes stop_codon:yes gene_type:complete
MISMVKFDKKLALGLAVLCSVINFLCMIDVVEIEGLDKGSLAASIFFVIVYFVVKQQEKSKDVKK